MEKNKIYQGEALETLKTFPDGSINMVMTSPPYWALRDYGLDEQLGLEKTFDEYINKLCDIFDEVKRTLKEDGSCWVNIGDTYCGGGSGQKDTGKDKCLCMIPSRFAIEMVKKGWILRNTIIWHKSNCMPSSVKDRFTVDFEYLFFFVKNKKYYYEQQFEELDKNRKDGDFVGGNKYQGITTGDKSVYIKNPNGRNMRTVWNINTEPFPAAHFAVYPDELCISPIKAGCPKEICSKCGKAKEKIFETNNPSKEFMEWDKNRLSGAKGSIQSRQCIKSLHRNKGGVYSSAVYKGYSDCGCNVEFNKGVVLDPFAGSGTTLKVAKDLGRDYVGIELNPEYIKIAEMRLKGCQGWQYKEMGKNKTLVETTL